MPRKPTDLELFVEELINTLQDVRHNSIDDNMWCVKEIVLAKKEVDKEIKRLRDRANKLLNCN